MKFVLIIGAGAVGKMTVGQELAKITRLRLFHNHMTIEPVIEVMGRYDGKTIDELRDVFFRNFAASDNEGMIFTYIWAFDQQADWDYIDHVRSIFEPYGTEFFCVELVASPDVRSERNKTENRLLHKPSKRDIEQSDERNRHVDEKYRTVSRPGEIPFEHYLRIENDHLSAEDAARLIQRRFSL